MKDSAFFSKDDTFREETVHNTDQSDKWHGILKECILIRETFEKLYPGKKAEDFIKWYIMETKGIDIKALGINRRISWSNSALIKLRDNEYKLEGLI